VTSELPYMRHRPRPSRASGTQAVGRVNCGYADGHVALRSDADLVDAATGLSTLDTLWSPADLRLNR
jgi:prepilin-type processing-associated H-X9-DG protein